MLKRLIPLLAIIMMAAGCRGTIPTSKSQDAEAVTQEFAVYLISSGEKIFSEQDLESYDAKSHIFTFTESGANKMQMYQKDKSMSSGLYGKDFLAKIGDKQLFDGKFWSYLSSASVQGLILTDVVLVGPDQKALKLEDSYPVPRAFDDSRLRQYFASIGKLKIE